MMFAEFSEKSYRDELEALFLRFPSVQNVPFGDAYKPGLERMLEFDRLLGNPSRSCRVIHVAGTNGKGSVSNMLASCLSRHGYRTGLYTSPHINDFRERMRIAGPEGVASMVPREYVYDFICRYKADFERLSLSFFEITTGLAFKWFADSDADWIVLEVGLGGRLDSTNIVTPEISVITSIGLDHCDLLGHSLAEIASEKAGIIKPGVPVVIGEDHPGTRPVFEAKAASCASGIIFAGSGHPTLEPRFPHILSEMDLRGDYQAYNLRTAASVLDLLGLSDPISEDALIHTASHMDFHGRWERLRTRPTVLCDIGHNAHALRHNFAQLRRLASAPDCSGLHIVYAIMADKDLDAILPLMPAEAIWHFATPSSRRSMPAEIIKQRYVAYLSSQGLEAQGLYAYADVASAVDAALSQAGPDGIIYIGGSTFAVSEAIPLFIPETDGSGTESRL